MNLSYWERDVYFHDVDLTVIGSGIVGLSTALHLRQRYPRAKIRVLEKGMLPEGASTKNAGFACFGTLSEIINYLETHPEEEIYQLVARRYHGIQKLRALLGDQTLDYHQWGGYEVFRAEDRGSMEKSLSRLDEINEWLYPVFGQKVYRKSERQFGLDHVIGMVETPLEGQIHTGNMMQGLLKLVASANIAVLNRTAVSGIIDAKSHAEIELEGGFTFKSKKVFLCTNAFTRELYDLDVIPARAQVLVTRPLSDLQIKGCFHFDQGFYFFRNIGSRILFGGGRNLDIAGETTTEFGVSERIQGQLEHYLREIILPGRSFEIEQRWSGIMGMGSQRSPLLKQLSENVFCGVRLSGTGVAIGSQVGAELAALADL